jgi:competence protein ComEA
VAPTAQERLALAVVAVLLAGAAGVRALRSEPPPAEWVGAAAGEEGPQALARHHAAVEAEVAEERTRRAPLAPGERLDPNAAPAEQLDRLPRVGPELAERIVARRSARGPYRTLADLDSVQGIGPAALAALAPHVTLPPAPASPSRAAARRTAAAPPSRAAAPAAERAAPRAVVDLNRATAAELDGVPGIGPALAGRIVESRARDGRFRRVDDLRRVPGIGARSLERIRPHVRATP